MKNLSMLLLSIFFFSCQQKESKNPSVEISDSIVTNKNKQEIKYESKKENKQIGDTIVMNFKNEEGLLVAEGSLDSIHPRVYIKFKDEDLGELKGLIIPTTGKGNIRFNQIIFPDQTSDGPFGMDLTIPLKQKGNYILVIGHSQMADNPFYGKFKVQLENKKG
ncbi:hypothetical protein IRZ83_01450 [Flavobacterium sp. JLP]|uniref:hypothetical protein n=1 Tax=unclassified Flavobacterium TaxID=196869 RepID=UPI00188A19D2|nr:MULTISPECIES: hypothetical protein [unclassified Flavobacterium]MBF4491191.1 hypothetical protein [Flavobacterium sp. MR2016-29]MBF4505312.1 hypothetical protein [Flavobacterium sp. JLP]